MPHARSAEIQLRPLHLCITETVYAIGIAIFFVIRGTCPKELLDKFWQMGAQQPVAIVKVFEQYHKGDVEIES